MSGSFRDSARAALLERVLGSLKNPDGSYPWRVLILDEITIKVLSSVLRMSELQNKGISLVENLDLAREPLQMEAVYFISPAEKSIDRLAEDQKQNGLYTACHVFFSSTLGSKELEKIKTNKNLIQKLKTLKEADFEVAVLDSRCFLTQQSDALFQFYQDKADPNSPLYTSEMEKMVSKLFTACITLNERPSIRYFSPQKFPANMAHRTQICEKVAQMLDSKIATATIEGFPETPTCDCVILDRAVDAVAPVIHEWTYEAMVYDLLPLEGNIYQRSPESAGSSTQAVLDEEDPLWRELRHMHIAEASSAVNDKIDHFKKRNAAARIKGAGNNSGLSTSDMKELIQSLPEYRDVLSNMTLHVDITGDLFKITNDRRLKEIGELEQDLVYGDKHSKDIISLLSTNQSLTAEDKMRLFMCYLATHPDKLDTERRLQWQKLAQLSAAQMDTMLNLEYLGISVTKKDGASLLSFVRKNKSKGIRKGKVGDQYAHQYALEKFQPELSDILEKLCAGELSVEEFPFIRKQQGTTSSSSAPAGSVRTNYAWGKKKKDAPELAVKVQTRRMIVFIVGGMSRSEMRVVHKLSSTLQRDIILGGTSVETPKSFIHELSRLSHSVDEESVKIAIE